MALQRRLGWLLIVVVATMGGAWVAGRALRPAPRVEEWPGHIYTDTARGAAHHPDALKIALWAQAVGVPEQYPYAIAWRETRNNPSPDTRGAAGEWGRYQITPATAAARCPHLNIRTSNGNLACFLKMTVEDLGKCGNEFRCAARIHNGSGKRAEAYADSVWATVQQLIREEMAT